MACRWRPLQRGFDPARAARRRPTGRPEARLRCRRRRREDLTPAAVAFAERALLRRVPRDAGQLESSGGPSRSCLRASDVIAISENVQPPHPPEPSCTLQSSRAREHERAGGDPRCACARERGDGCRSSCRRRLAAPPARSTTSRPRRARDARGCPPSSPSSRHSSMPRIVVCASRLSCTSRRARPRLPERVGQVVRRPTSKPVITQNVPPPWPRYVTSEPLRPASNARPELGEAGRARCRVRVALVAARRGFQSSSVLAPRAAPRAVGLGRERARLARHDAVRARR